MRILLANPPAVSQDARIVREGRCMQRAGAWTAVWSPISLALCAATLRQDGHACRIFDGTVDEGGAPRFWSLVEADRPELVVINMVTPAVNYDIAAINEIKRRLPETTIAVIGIHATALSQECFDAAPGLDVIIKAEPEITLRELTRANLKPAGVEGLCYRDGENIVHNDRRKMIQDLDALPFPAWDLVDRSKYIMPLTDRPFLLIATGRGCPYPCNYCADPAYYGHPLRNRGAATIVDELQWAGEEFGITEFLFWSEAFTLSREHALSICDEICARGLKIRYVANSRVDNVDPDVLAAMKRSGCWMIGYGMESGQQHVLDAIKKRATVEQAENAVRWSKEAGISVTAHCVIGFPEETEDDIRATIAFAKSLPLDFAQFYCCVPFPGSPLYERARKNGWIVDEDWAHFEQNMSVMNTPHLTAERIMELRREAYREFYSRPRQMVRVLKHTKGWRTVFALPKLGLDFLGWSRADIDVTHVPDPALLPANS